MRAYPSAVLLFAFSASAALAASSRSLSLAQMTESAGSIVSGRVVEVKRTVDSETRLPVQIVSLAVQQRLKGDGGGTFVFKQFDDQTAVYAEGDEVLLFLYPSSRLGLTSAVGLGQGYFRMKLINGVRHFANLINNRGLLKEGGAPGAQLTVAQPGVGRPYSGPVREEDLLSLTREAIRSTVRTRRAK